MNENLLVQSPKMTATISEWCDYCELLTLMSDGGKMDSDQLCDVIVKAKDFRATDEEKEDDEKENEEKSVQDRKKKEKATTKIEDVFKHVNLRNSLLLEKYPFQINDDGQMCCIMGELHQEQTLYLILLCAANLKYVKKQTSLTSDLEVVSLLYMRRLLPTMEFRLFGSSNTNHHLTEGDYILDTKLKDRMEKLAVFARLKSRGDEIGGLDEQNHGDGGLDIVGVRKMDDVRRSLPLIFGQCACSRDQWSQKQYSTSTEEWSKYFKVTTTSIQRYIFVADWYINSDKQLPDENKITSCVFVDRQRLMSLADASFLEKCCTKDILELEEP